MPWQFGGNIQPVRIICEFDWKQCPGAIIYYVWSEIVTDVVDCLTNEAMFWRGIAMLFVCTLLVYTIYSKTRWMYKTTIDRDNLNIVGCKVQDLELKVNILTYKMQYGTWPLPRHIRGTGIENGLRNVRLTLTNPTDRNSWLKHMLLSPSENTGYVPYAKIGPRSVRCLSKLINLETKYMASRFSRDASPTPNREKSSGTSSDKSITYERISKKFFDIDEAKEKRVPKSENLSMRNKESEKCTNNSWSETQVLKYRENPRVQKYWGNRLNSSKKNSSSVTNMLDKRETSPEERVNSTQKTLHQVKEKLENLHSVLRICGKPDSAVEKNDGRCSRKELAESILQDLKNLGNLPTKSESDAKTSGNAPQPLDSNTEDSECIKNVVDNTSELEQTENGPESSSAQNYETSLKIRCKRDPEKSVPENVQNNDKEISVRRDSGKLENFGQAEKNCVTESSENESQKFVPMEMDDDTIQPSQTSSHLELSRDSDFEDKSNATLLCEALNFKRALLTKIEVDKDEEKVEDCEERKITNFFQSKLLDIISEEQSVGSLPEKTSKNFAMLEVPVENKEKSESDREKEMKKVVYENPENSKLALTSETSEYFSLSNLEEKMLAQTIIDSPRKIETEMGSDLTGDECSDVNKMEIDEKKGNLHKNINDLVNQSVQNIREYVEVFLQMKNDAILEAKKVDIDDNENTNSFDLLYKFSSKDSILHFVNTAIESKSEELSVDFSELAINNLMDLEGPDSKMESSKNTDSKSDFTLKRRPGLISLAEEKSSAENKKIPGESLEALSVFESTHSQFDLELHQETEFLSSEPSCKELLLDYTLESGSDFSDERLQSTLNLIEFDEDLEIKEKIENDDKPRAGESPLTGRTVIRTTSSFASNLEARSTNEIVDQIENEEFEDPTNFCNGNPDSDPEINFEELVDTNPIVENSQENKITEPTDEHFIEEIVETKCFEEKNEHLVKSQESCAIDRTDSAIGDISKNSVELTENSVEIAETIEITENRPDSGNTIIITDSSRIIHENHEIPSAVNLSSENSGTYLDASSRNFLNSSGTSLTLDKSILNPPANGIEIPAMSKSARRSSSPLLQPRIPWNAPKRGSSLISANFVRSKKPDKISSKLDKPKESSQRVNISSDVPKKSRSQSSAEKQPKAKINLNSNRSGELESSNVTATRTSAKNIIDLVERRSRSYLTPRKSEASPRNSATYQPENTQRPSRTRKDSEKMKINTDNMKKAKSMVGLNARMSSRSCVTKASSKSCIPIPKRKIEAVRQTDRAIRAKSPMRGPLMMSTSSLRNESRQVFDSPIMGIRPEGNPLNRGNINSYIFDTAESNESLKKIDQQEIEDRSSGKLPENRTVIYVNIVAEQENSATRVVDPKTFLEYLKDRDLKVQNVFDQENGCEGTITGSAELVECNSPRILTVVSSAVGGNVSNIQTPAQHAANSATTGSWSLRVEQREIEVSAKPSVIDTSTSISDLPQISMETRGSLGKFKIFEVPKELTKDEYIVLLEALNQDPNLNQLREMDKLCKKLGLGFRE